MCGFSAGFMRAWARAVWHHAGLGGCGLAIPSAGCSVTPTWCGSAAMVAGRVRVRKFIQRTALLTGYGVGYDVLA